MYAHHSTHPNRLLRALLHTPRDRGEGKDHVEAIIIIAAFWLALQLIGGTAGKAAQRAMDKAETPAGRVAAGIGGTLLLIVLGGLAWLACVAMLLQAAP